VRCALAQGYRPIDCASSYGHEAGIGTALSGAITTGVVEKGLERHIGVTNVRAARARHSNHSGTDGPLGAQHHHDLHQRHHARPEGVISPAGLP
jgi:diketogulonate reductase-like aldo/keto reductase